jgi:hypothetical protein
MRYDTRTTKRAGTASTARRMSQGEVPSMSTTHDIRPKRGGRIGKTIKCADCGKTCGPRQHARGYCLAPPSCYKRHRLAGDLDTHSKDGPLSSAIAQAKKETGQSLDDFSVLSRKNDPFRLDTGVRHKEAKWLAGQLARYGIEADRTIHLRGLHYMLVGDKKAIKPDGKQYANNEDDYFWLNGAGKAMRWLGYVPFEQIVDHRNTPPEVRPFAARAVWPYVDTQPDVELPDADDFLPSVRAGGVIGRQHHKLILVGEKSSLEPILAPIAEEHQADLYLPSGEMSDTLVFQMAREGSEDGRRMVVLYFSDCDPAGWQMPISVARKLQALAVIQFTDLEYEVRRVSLTPEQVLAAELPSTPLKLKEKRGPRWKELMGVEQTEIDALTSLHPELLEQQARDAIAPYFDYTLTPRVAKAYAKWRAKEQLALEDQTDWSAVEGFAGKAAEQLEEIQSTIADASEQIETEVEDFQPSALTLPQAKPPDNCDAMPLICSDWSFAEQSIHLKESRAYEEEDE